jgi:tetratricopeptide (TPR) repeat protein
MKIYAPGTRIVGQYEIASKPLIGGMGIVYLCYDHQEDRPVALKTFKPKYIADRAARDRFLREGSHWIELGSHPHIVRCHEVFRIDPEVYLVLELVAKEPGREDASLRSWLIPGHPLPIEQSLRFALQIAHGLRHAASVIPGFVHRDLKPENILVGADMLDGVNRLRVTDFGLVTILSPERFSAPPGADNPDQERTRLTRGVVGTPHYMASEQWRGEPVSAATDIYALGCILYEMLTGKMAAEGNSLHALQQAHCDPQRPSLPDRLPHEVLKVAERCLASMPRDRYGDWETLTGVLTTAYEAATGSVAPAAVKVVSLSKEEDLAAGWSYSEIGASYLNLGKAAVAKDYFERALAAGRVGEAQELESAALGNLGLAYADLGDVWSAINYYEQSLVIDREIGYRRGEGITLSNLGNAYADLGDVQRAIGFFEQALAICREIGNLREESVTLNNLGLAYIDLGDAQRAVSFFEQRLEIARKLEDRRGEGNALDNIGIAYLNLGDAGHAIEFFERALAVSREMGDRRGEGNALGNMGIAYLNLGDARHAISVFEQALAISREIGDRRGEGAILGNLGSAYSNLGHARHALDFFEQRLEIAREIDDLIGLANVAGNMAILHAQQGETSRALELAKEAASIFAQIGHTPNIQRAQQLIAQLQGGDTPSSSHGRE